MNLQLVLLAIFPSIILALIILFYDRYDKEPFGLLMKVFFFGMLATIPTIIAEVIGNMFNFFSGIIGIAVEAFIVVGLAEEFFKRRVVLKHAFNHPAFDEKLDGIVYCGFAALGFATLENILYVAFYFADAEGIWLTRALLSVPAHALLGVTMGYYLAMAKFCMNPQKRQSYMTRSLVVPAALHGLYDFMLMSGMQIFTLIFIPFVIYLWISSIKKLNQYHRESKQMHT